MIFLCRRIAFPCLVLLLSLGVVPSLRSEQRKILVRTAQKDSAYVTGLDTAGTTWVPLVEFFSSARIPCTFHDSSGTLEVSVFTRRLQFTRRSPFVLVTEISSGEATVYQMSSPLRGAGARPSALLPNFVSFLNDIWPGGARTDSALTTISLGPTVRPFDITGLDIEKKLNGYLLTVRAIRKLGDIEKWMNPDGWLFVTVANATADTSALKAVKPAGALRQVLTFQSPTSVQLTFRLAPDVVQADILNDTDSNNLLISLRTESEAERKAAERKKQETIQEGLEKRRGRWKMDVIVIDPGHGGKDPGALGVSNVREKDVTLAIALRLGRLIQQNLKGVKVVYTRTTDTFVELYRRTQIANEAGGKLFISIHCNSMEQKPSRAHGFEIYLLRPGKTEDAITIAARENASVRLEEGYESRYKKLTEEEFIIVTMAQSAYVKYSEEFAQLTAKSMGTELKIRNSGVKQAGFYVLVGASMPNVLVETGYLSNRKDEKFLKSTSGQKKIASAILNGIRAYKTYYEEALREGQGGTEGD